MSSQHDPEIILLNETALPEEGYAKILGYKSLNKSQGRFTGVSILIKDHLKYEIIAIEQDNILAIKLYTSYGIMIIATAYVPPRTPSLPTIALNKLFSHNVPTLLMGDLNAHHPMMDNESVYQPFGDSKGKQLQRLATLKKLRYLGPHFKTFITKRARGKPDLVIANKQFDIFHHRILAGENYGSDHIPIIMNIQAQPFKVIKSTTPNINTLNIKEFQNELNKIECPSLDNKPTDEINKTTSMLMKNIAEATEKCCQKNTTIVIKNYEPTSKIKRKLQQYSAACLNYYRYGAPNTRKLNEILNEIRELVSTQQADQWKQVVDTATESYGEPKKFWQKIKRLNSDPRDKIYPTLQTKITIDDSEESDFGEEREISITNPKEQAELMSNTWRKVFKPQKGQEFSNANTKMVKAWFTQTRPRLNPKPVINFNNLIEDHPIMRPIDPQEITSSIAYTKNKAPGLSGITPQQIKALPKNCRTILREIYNSMLATSSFPDILLLIKMIFIHKPGKDPSNPLNYRPICLLEVLLKIFERIIAQRILYYLEHHNLVSERQFGFRKGRCTQHPISFADEIITENKKQKRATLITTRDTEKAFDTVWFKGLLYKMNSIPCATDGLLALMLQFLTKRCIFPHMSDEVGSIIKPTAGVPQGSCIGPILYMIFVNDHPQPIYKDTIISQFADDLVHIITSDRRQKSRSKAWTLQRKAKKELEQTLKWERDWRIKSNTNKSKVAVFGSQKETLNAIGGIKINNVAIAIENSIKILGCTINNSLKSKTLINTNISKAVHNLVKLYRFRSAPIKVKKLLYKAIIRPTIEYPYLLLHKTGKTNMKKLQRLQNKGLRFILNVKRSDKVKIKTLHEKTKIDTINVRLNKLAKKMLYKAKTRYLDRNDCSNDPYYKHSDYLIQDQPLRNKRRTIAERISKYIYRKEGRKSLLHSLPQEDNWVTPEAGY